MTSVPLSTSKNEGRTCEKKPQPDACFSCFGCLCYPSHSHVVSFLTIASIASSCALTFFHSLSKYIHCSTLKVHLNSMSHPHIIFTHYTVWPVSGSNQPKSAKPLLFYIHNIFWYVFFYLHLCLTIMSDHHVQYSRSAFCFHRSQRIFWRVGF